MNTSNFINEFEKYYFHETYKPNDRWKLKGIKTTYKAAEEKIVNKLRNGEHDEYVIAWKVGAYKKEDQKIDRQKIKGRKSFDVSDYIINTYNNKDWIKCTISDALKDLNNHDYSAGVKRLSSVFSHLQDKSNCDGLGTVYLINSLFFLSKGEIPLYDKNVYKAVQALFLGKSPSQIIVSEAPPKEDVVGAMLRLLEYMWLLDQVFGKSKTQKSNQFSDCEHVGYISRGLDRALWVYGQSQGQCFEDK